MNIFDEMLVIVVDSANVAGVYSVNGKAGYVTIDKSDIGLSNVENISITGVSGYLQDQIDNNTIVGDFVYLSGDQTISGIKTFISRPTVNGTGILLSGEAANLPTTIVYTTGNQTISGIKNFVLRPEVNNISVVISGEAYPSNNPSGFITGVEKQTKLFDYVTGTPIYMYVGSAIFGSSQNDPVWDIYRTEIDQNGLVISNLLATNAAWTGRYLENYM